MEETYNKPDFTQQQLIDSVYDAFDNMSKEQQAYWKPLLNMTIDRVEEIEEFVADSKIITNPE